MPNLARAITATIVSAAMLVSAAGVATAAPTAGALAIKNAAPSNTETVRWWRGWWWGVPAGVAAGVVVGRALTAPYYYGPRYYGYYGYGYAGYGYPGPYGYAPPPAAAYGPGYAPPPGAAYGPGYARPPGTAAAPGAQAAGDAVAYCRQRFKSYDARSGTYLGSDGQRHPCP